MKIRVRQREENCDFGPFAIVDIPIEVPVAGALSQEGVKHIELVFDSGLVVQYTKVD